MEKPTEQREPWRDLWKRAHEFACNGRSSDALPIYVQAIDAAKEQAQDADVAHLMHDAGNAATDIGQFEYAKSLYALSLIWAERANFPPIETLGTRIEKARVEMVRGRPELVYSETTILVHEARALWTQSAQDPEFNEVSHQNLKRHLCAALDLRRQCASRFQQWDVGFECLEEMQHLVEDGSEEHIAIRLAEVEVLIAQNRDRKRVRHVFEDFDLKEITETCIEDFQRIGSIAGAARAWHTLSMIEMADGHESLALESALRGLALTPAIVDPIDCAIRHDHIAMCWQRSTHIENAADHWLAALVIRLATGISPKMSRLALTQHRQYAVRHVHLPFQPRSISDLLEKANFLPLKPFLQSLNVSIEVLQERVDQILRDRPEDPDPSSPGKPPTPAAPAAAAAVFLDEFYLDEFPMPGRKRKAR